MLNEVRVSINSDSDIVVARQQGRIYATELGFQAGDLTLIATAISELARNIVEFAKHGEIVFHALQRGSRTGIEIIARDSGPGITNVTQALQDGYSSKRSLGLGLPGTKRLMDEFDIVSGSGNGTTVTIKKWIL